MSGPDGFVSVKAKNVEVTKTINDYQFETLAVVMTIHSDREEAALVNVSEPIPEGAGPDDIWFHSEYGGDYWDLSPDSVTFSRPLEPGKQCTAVYGLHDFDREEPELLSEPTIRVDPDAAGEIQEEVHEQGPGEAPLDTPMEDTPPETTDEIESGDSDTTSEAMAESPRDLDAGTTNPPDKATDESEARQVRVPVSDGIGRVLAKEFRQDRVTTEDRQLIREALAPGDGSVGARLDHLRGELEDLVDYTDALENLLDKERGARTVIESFDERAGELSSEIDSVRGSIEQLSERIEHSQETIDDTGGHVSEMVAVLEDHESEVNDVDERVHQIQDEVESIDEELGRLKGINRRLDGLEDDIDAVQDDFAELATFCDRLTAVVGAGQGADSVGGKEDVEEIGDSTVIEDE